MGMREGLNVWIVDGDEVRRDIYPAFLYGGNPQRYPFIPQKEIWIDNAIAAEEFEYTVAHELLERSLMARQGMSYDDAHNRALELEQVMRHADDSASRAHEQELPRVSPTDCDGIKEIAGLPDSIFLHNIYRVAARKPKRHFRLDCRRCGSAPGHLSRFWVERQRPGMSFYSLKRNLDRRTDIVRRNGVFNRNGVVRTGIDGKRNSL